VFSADLYSAVAANPYIAFHTVATASGTLVFTWEGDNGFVQTEAQAITVT
jgi:sulfur-oxidizing protein SoxZ